MSETKLVWVIVANGCVLTAQEAYHVEYEPLDNAWRWNGLLVRQIRVNSETLMEVSK